MNEKAVKWCYVCCIRGRNIRHEERDADRYISSNQPKIIGQVIGDAPGAPWGSMVQIRKAQVERGESASDVADDQPKCD